jgi:5-(carboxyamino)imidazole ribonucleotide mutase
MDKKSNLLVSVVIGSDSDLPIMKESVSILEKLDIPHEVFLTSAHRSPERTLSFAKKAAKRGIKIIIVGAGAIVKSGAKNAALLAARILALEDHNLRKKLDAYVKAMAETIEEKQKNL